jgi:signal transduction histidine kinase/ActR/RegA family two-component response regulator
MSGYREDELLGHTASGLAIWANPEDSVYVGFMVEKRQPIYALERQVRRKDGSLRWITYSGDLVELGGVEYLLSGAIDITDRKRVEEAEQQIQNRLNLAQRMEAIGTLAGGIAHDFNNILGAMIGYTDLALSELPEESPVRCLLENIEHAGTRATELVRQILAFSRRIPLEKKPIEPVIAVKEAMKLIRASLPATIAIREQFESAWWVFADAGQIHQIAMNLCTNAGLAMREGGVLEVGMHDLESDAALLAQQSDLRPGRYVCLSVKDTGCGIPPENIGRIFEPFFTTRAPEEGAGIGLSVVHDIVRSYGGAIRVFSEVDRGSTFEVFLPACETPAKVEPEASASCEGHERVLFVDDEKDLIEIARRGLMRLGYDVVAFNDPQLALTAFRAEPGDFDVVITDMTMPGLTGDVLASELRRIRPGIPVALLSGFSDRWTAERARAAGFDGVIDKPLRPAALAQLVRELCDRR